ncbi:hypothetical protein V6N13_104409 [Hibiscus sabdariffa]
MPKQKQLDMYLEEIVLETGGVDITGAIPTENLEIEEEEENYVVDEVEETDSDSDSGFEISDNDMLDEVRVEEVDYETLMMKMEFGKETKENESHLNDNDSGSDSLHNLSGNESDKDDRKKPPKCPEFNDEVDMTNPQFKKGMKFSCKEILKEAIREYGIKSRHDVKFKRVNKVGVDGNDSLYPICWVVVEAENESFWHWFLSFMMTDLKMINSYHFTFMLDEQKGLIEVLLELFPHSQHRKCVRHLYSNFKNVVGFKGKNLKDAL